MPSEAQVKCSNPKCGYFNVGQVCTKCGTLTPPQAEVVASSRSGIPELEQEKRDAFDAGFRDGYLDQIPVYFRKGDLGVAYAHGLKAGEAARIPPEPPPAQGKENTCSNDSGVSSSATGVGSSQTSKSSPSATGSESSIERGNVPRDASAVTPNSQPNPPAWATPQILAACGPGEVLWHMKGHVRAYPSRKYWKDGERDGHTVCTEDLIAEERHEMYRIPTPPAAKCDGSGTIKWDTGGPAARCNGCPTCKPEPKDGAEEEALEDAGDDFASAYFRGKPNPGESAIRFLARLFTAAIRADREKQAARPDLDKVRELCEWVGHVAVIGSRPRILAREVLALLEGL